MLNSIKPYGKAIVAGVLGAVVVAAGYYDAAWLQVAAAAVSPVAVYFVRNVPATVE